MSPIKTLLIALKGVANIVLFAFVKIWNFFDPLLYVGGLIGCLMLPVPWPMKFVYAALLLVFFFLVSKCIGKLENDWERNQRSKLRK